MFSFSTATATAREPARDHSQGETERSAPTEPPPPHSDFSRDPYRGAILVLLGVAFLGTLGAVTGGLFLGNLVLLDVAVTLGISSGVLAGVALAQRERAKPAIPAAPATTDEVLSPAASTEMVVETDTQVSAAPATINGSKTRRNPWEIVFKIARRFRNVAGTDVITRIRISTGVAGLAGIGLVLLVNLVTVVPAPFVAAIVAGGCFIAAGLAATAVHYLAELQPSSLPEAPDLCRGARVVTWILVLAGLSMGLAWADQQTVLRIVHLVLLIFNAAICCSLIEKPRTARVAEAVPAFPLDLTLLSILGSRPNIVASVLDAGEQQLGIDLRSTWALTVVRRSVEPLVVGLCLTGWLSTSLTVIGVEEQGLVERLGVPVAGQPLSPGLHLHWPWPVDQVFRIPVMRVQSLTVGHEGKEQGGPEDVLWARQHAANEYTLLLGNGRDLITIDAGVQFRISDARAWRYHTQNPADALSAIAYRAVMRNTVNRTLADALSENVATLTNQMRSQVQSDADALGLGVEVMGFTVGGMHPPVAVAPDYQAVVSAELGKVTSVVNAQAFRNKTVPNAEAYVVAVTNNARAEGAQELGSAAGEAWAFRALEAQYRSSPQEYLFRRRLETLEKGLFGRSFTIVDSRFQRDGGELWVIP
jgi:regulator of protease activity HflC (stomatin/prohibitin superfamily)